MRKSFILTFVLIALLSMAMGVQALESKTIDRSNGESAFASCTETNGNIVTDTYLSVTKTNDGTDIYMDIYSWDTSDGNYWVGKSGYLFTKDNVFSVDKKLNSASLSEIQLEVYNWETGVMEPMTIKANWTGVGEISKSSFKSSSTDGDYTFKSSDSSTYRTASVTGSVNNRECSTPYGNLVKFKSAYINMEK